MTQLTKSPDNSRITDQDIILRPVESVNLADTEQNVWALLDLLGGKLNDILPKSSILALERLAKIWVNPLWWEALFALNDLDLRPLLYDVLQLRSNEAISTTFGEVKAQLWLPSWEENTKSTMIYHLWERRRFEFWFCYLKLNVTWWYNDIMYWKGNMMNWVQDDTRLKIYKQWDIYLIELS